MRRRWTDAEKQRLREAWGKVPGPELAAELGRSLTGVNQMVSKLRLSLSKHIHWAAPIVEAVAILHAEGLGDGEIAERMAIVFEPGATGYHQVRAIRRDRLGLPTNPESTRRARRRGVESQRRTLGIRHGGDLRRLAFCRFAEANGWPEDLRPREVQILNVLATAGVPMNMLELANRIGMRTDRSDARHTRVLLTGNGPGGTYTASLVRRGLLTRHANACRSGRTGCRNLYSLGPAALAILERRASCQNETAATAS